MKKGLILVVIIVLLGLWGITSYNGLITKKESIDSAQADIDTALQRRADLIPNLVNTVKGYMSYEQGVIKEITTAREKMVSAGSTSERIEADQQLEGALSRLMVIVENYPELKADLNFINLQDELSGSENRIATSRKDYNDTVKDYNTSIKRFPGIIMAKLFGFDEAGYFDADPEAKKVPTVDFGV